jgi:RNA polymerase sigma factor (sigma-70 family)
MMVPVRKSESRVLTAAEVGHIYTSHRTSLVSFAKRWVGDSHRAEELVQEALIKVIIAAPEIASSEHALNYLKSSVRSLCLDFLRADGARPTLMAIDESNVDFWSNEEDHVEILAAAEDAAVIRKALALLSPAERAALVMWEVDGRSAEEIAKELGIKQSSVRHTVSRARASLRRILSEYIIDEERGLTALQLLSTSYKKSSEIAKKSSKAVMSFILVLLAFLGFNSLTHIESTQSPASTGSVAKPSLVSKNDSVSTPKPNSSSGSTSLSVTSSTKSVGSLNARAATMKFAGLDGSGVPTGFTITDGTGVLGSLYVNSRDAILSDSDLQIPWIAKTASAAANILLSQTISQDGSGTSYNAFVSFGRDGKWIPVTTRVISTDVERLLSGNYMVTAVLQVKSEVETTIVTPASAGGRDLEAAPSRIVTRVLLNSGKTQIVAQAVQVIERVNK